MQGPLWHMCEGSRSAGDIEEALAETLTSPQRHIEVRGRLPCSPNPARAMDESEINCNDRRRAARGVDMEGDVIGLWPMESFVSSLPSLPQLHRGYQLSRDLTMLLVLLSLHLYLVRPAIAICYYYDDSVTPEDVSCLLTCNSRCSSVRWICLSNGLS
jgi:hypothetical protein